MKTKTVNLYTFDELSDKAKEKAREWWREAESELFDPLENDAIETAAKILGIEFKPYSVTLYGGGTRAKPSIWWTLHVQGAGASFDGTYRYAKGSAKAIKAEFGTDEVLHGIARDLAELEREHGYRVSATIKADSRYHSLDVECDPYDYEGTTARELHDIFQRFARWIYKTIDGEYSSRMEDEYVDDAILANEYTFLENGTRED